LQFKNGASQCFSVILEKFKEKKANVVAALVEAIDALYPCLGIEAVQVTVS
jgi:cytoskeleton-associated protein 5